MPMPEPIPDYWAAWCMNLNWTRLSCHRFVANRVRLSLFVLAYNSRSMGWYGSVTLLMYMSFPSRAPASRFASREAALSLTTTQRPQLSRACAVRLKNAA